jgi:DNA-binding PadR family transcriptional regulator
MRPTPQPGRHRSGHHHHPDPTQSGGRPIRRGRGSRARVARGDVRLALLSLLAEEPMHGYQLMQAISDRSGGRWIPSPGAVYPAISQLEDEGLVTVNAQDGRKLVTLTDTGRQLVEEQRASRPDPFAALGGTRQESDLRGLLEQVHVATRTVGRNGTDAQAAAAAEILKDTRRRLYLLLAEDADGPTPAD